MGKPAGYVPARSPDEKKLEQARARIALLSVVVDAARGLAAGWEASGFYDRQDAAGAVALHEALAAYDAKG